MITYMTFTTDNEFYKLSVYTNDEEERLLFENIVVFNPSNSIYSSREQFFEATTKGYENRNVIFEITRLVSAEVPSFYKTFKKQC